jgi:NADPH:quinone reductase-like Zn-dependent oxidoreductase
MSHLRIAGGIHQSSRERSPGSDQPNGARGKPLVSTSKVELVRSRGPDDIIDYTREEIVDETCRFDVIFDTAGNREASYLRRALTPKGTLVLAGGEGGGRWLGMGRVMRAKALSPFVGQRMTNYLGRPKAEDLLVLKDLIEAGAVTPVIGTSYPLSDVPNAIRELGTGQGRGKVVVTV